MHATRVVKITINNDVILAVACLLRERILLPRDPATHSISATTSGLFRGIFWKVTSLNISHWSKRVMHATRVVKITINNDVILAVACLLPERWTADWLIGQCRTFHPHILMSYRK